MKTQKKHYGIEIPEASQPKCAVCDSPMAINISYPNNDCSAFWYCLNNDCTSEFEQVDFSEWLKTASTSVKSHFIEVGLSMSEITERSFLDRGYNRVGGHIWGGGTWGTLKGKSAWTGHKGQSMEYWQKG